MNAFRGFIFLLALSASVAQRQQAAVIEPAVAAEPTAVGVKPNPAAGDAVNPRIFGSGLGTFFDAGVGIASGIAQSLLTNNRPAFQGGFNQPQAINFAGPGGDFGGNNGPVGGFPGAFNRPGLNRPGFVGGNFDRPGGIVDGGFNRPGFAGELNRPGFGGSDFNRPGFGGSDFNRPGFGGSGFNRPGIGGELNRPGFGGSNFNRPGFGGEIHRQDLTQGGVNRPGFGGGNLNRPGLGGGNFNRPGGVGGNINNLGGNNFNRPNVVGSGGLGRPTSPLVGPEFVSSLTKPGTCPAVRPVCPDRVRAGPEVCSLDPDCKFGEKCCFDRCLERKVCKRSL